MAFIADIYRFFLPFGIKRRGAERTEVAPPSDETPDPAPAERREAMAIPEEERRLAERARVQKSPPRAKSSKPGK